MPNALHDQLRAFLPMFKEKLGCEFVYQFDNTAPVIVGDDDLVPVKMYFRRDKSARVKRLLGYSPASPTPQAPRMPREGGKGVCIAVVYQWADRVLSGKSPADESWLRRDATLMGPMPESIQLQTRYEARFLRRVERIAFTNQAGLAGPDVHASQGLARELGMIESSVSDLDFARLAAKAPHALSLRLNAGSHAMGIACGHEGSVTRYYLLDPNIGLAVVADAANFNKVLAFWLQVLYTVKETVVVELQRAPVALPAAAAAH